MIFVRGVPEAIIAALAPIPSGKLETKIATTSAMLIPSPLASPMPEYEFFRNPVQQRAEGEAVS